MMCRVGLGPPLFFDARHETVGLGPPYVAWAVGLYAMEDL